MGPYSPGQRAHLGAGPATQDHALFQGTIDQVTDETPFGFFSDLFMLPTSLILVVEG